MGEMADDALDIMINEMLDDFDECDIDHNTFFVKYKPKFSGPGNCPICGAPTIVQYGKYGKFYGCTKYPNCKGSRYV